MVDDHQEGATRRGTYLVERNVVLDVVCLFFGLGVIPGDILDGFAVDGCVVVRSGSERGFARSAYQMVARSDWADPFHGQTVL